MGTVKIFIASSAELKEDREKFDLFLYDENRLRIEKGVSLISVKWEYFLNSVSQTGKQDDYNEKLRNSDIVICLFRTKAGKYTVEEFDTALEQFNKTGSPLIYTYFNEPETDGNPISVTPDETISEADRKSLGDFKKKLEGLKHFYTRYTNSDNLQNQFRKQLDILQSDGFEKLKEDFKTAVTNYNSANIVGNNNVVVQGSNNNTITVINNGVSEEYKNDLNEIKALLKSLSLNTIQVDGRDINIDNVNDSNFGFLMGRVSKSKALPDELKDKLITDSNTWVISLQSALYRKEKITVKSKNNKIDVGLIFEYYGWLIETYLVKTSCRVGLKPTLRRLSFLAEAYQSSLRFLCFVQLSQVWQLKKKPASPPPAINEFIKLEKAQLATYDYSSLLLITTDLLKESEPFMPEIGEFVKKLSDTSSDLYSTNLFLENNRNKLIKKEIKEDDQLPELLDEYLTALMYWLVDLTFISRYKMVSIMDIKLDYRLGETVHFGHVYGEVNTAFGESGEDNENLEDTDSDTLTVGTEEKVETSKRLIEGVYTFNQSILLLKDRNIDSGLDNIGEPDSYLSLSPLIIDKSVYYDPPRQTPEIYFYTGMDLSKKQYNYNYFKNELLVYENASVKSNKEFSIKEFNLNTEGDNEGKMNKGEKMDIEKLDSLYAQLDALFKPFKIRNK